jgi:hypothetical protein
MAPEIYSAWRAAGIVAAVRINPLETEDYADLADIMRGHPDVVIMSKVAEPEQVVALAEEVGRSNNASIFRPAVPSLRQISNLLAASCKPTLLLKPVRVSPAFLVQPKTWRRTLARHAARLLLNSLMLANAST